MMFILLYISFYSYIQHDLIYITIQGRMKNGALLWWKMIQRFYELKTCISGNLEVSMIFLNTLKETEALINIVIWFHNIDYQ